MNEPPGQSDADRQSTSDRSRGLILCPLRFEYHVLSDAPELARRCKVICCGRGVDAVLNTLLEYEGARGRSYSFVLMAGLAGALHHSLNIGDVRCARRVVTDDGESWMATWPGTREQCAGVPTADILTTRRVLRLPDEKRDANRTTSCTLVDTESAALAAWASGLNIPWGVVRGVSDTVEDTLPDGVEEWTDAGGRTRLGRIMYDLVRKPGNMHHLRKLKRKSTAAMVNVRIALEAMTAGAVHA